MFMNARALLLSRERRRKTTVERAVVMIGKKERVLVCVSIGAFVAAMDVDLCHGLSVALSLALALLFLALGTII